MSFLLICTLTELVSMWNLTRVEIQLCNMLSPEGQQDSLRSYNWGLVSVPSNTVTCFGDLGFLWSTFTELCFGWTPISGVCCCASRQFPLPYVCTPISFLPINQLVRYQVLPERWESICNCSIQHFNRIKFIRRLPGSIKTFLLQLISRIGKRSSRWPLFHVSFFL